MAAPAPPVYRPVPFAATLRAAGAGGPRALVAAWLALAAVAVPSGMATRLLDWTGIPLTVGGADLFVTVYIPLLFCTPAVLWLGYGWGAVPAYLSTAAVAALGGMPPAWIALFAFANPIGLAVFWLAYQAVPMRTDLRTVGSVAFFGVVAFVAALVGSGGAFVWAYTNQVGFDSLMPVWQGWWLGGFLQTLLLTGPTLALLGPAVERWKAARGLGRAAAQGPSRRRLLATAGVVAAAVVGYVVLARLFATARLDGALAAADPAVAGAVGTAVEGLAVVHWVLLLLLGAVGVFGYHVATRWASTIQASADDLAGLNARLLKEVAERARAEAEVSAQAAELRRANETKDRFFSIIAHDLRSPLAAVLMLSELLAEQGDAFDRDEAQEMAGRLHGAAENLFELLENLLTWSRLQLGGLRHTPEPVDLAALVGEAGRLLTPAAAEKGVGLAATVPPGLVVWADPNMLRSVVLNLLSNGVKFTEPGGTVGLLAVPDGDRVAVEVRDSGVGMTADQVAGLFAVDTSSSTEGTAGEQGTGLGLVLCHEMVAHHGSALAVESAPGEGTAFSFALPLPPTPSAPAVREVHTTVA